MLIEVWGIECRVLNLIFEILVLTLLLKALEGVFGSIHHFHVVLDIDSLGLKPFIESGCKLIIDDFLGCYLLSAFEVVNLRKIIEISGRALLLNLHFHLIDLLLQGSLRCFMRNLMDLNDVFVHLVLMLSLHLQSRLLLRVQAC